MPYPYFGPPLIKNCIGHDIMQSLYTILKKKNIKMLILLLSVSEIKHYDPVIKDASVQEGVSVLKCVSVLHFRSSLCRPGSVGASHPVWWSAQVPAGSPPARHPHCSTRSDGPHFQRLERSVTNGTLSEIICIVHILSKAQCWRNVPLTRFWTFSTLNTKPQEVVSVLWP